MNAKCEAQYRPFVPEPLHLMWTMTKPVANFRELFDDDKSLYSTK